MSVIAIFDLTNEGRTLVADTFLTFGVWFTVAALCYAVDADTVSLFMSARPSSGSEQQGR